MTDALLLHILVRCFILITTTDAEKKGDTFHRFYVELNKQTKKSNIYDISQEKVFERFIINVLPYTLVERCTNTTLCHSLKFNLQL